MSVGTARRTGRTAAAVAVWLLVLLAGLRATDVEQEARAIEAALMAPCCYAQQVSVHQSDAAEQVKRDIRVRLARGEPRQQILDAYVSQYGKRILAQPPAAGFDLTLYVLPVLLFVASLAAVAALVRRLSAGPSGDAGGGEAATRMPPGPTPLLDQRLDDELRDLD